MAEVTFTDEQLVAIRTAATPLFTEAVAQGMHSVFALNCESWGLTWAFKLEGDLTRLSEANEAER